MSDARYEIVRERAVADGDYYERPNICAMTLLGNDGICATPEQCDWYIEPFGGRLIEEQRSVLSRQYTEVNYKLDSKPELKDFYLYDYDMRTPEQRYKEELEIAEAKAKAQAETMKRFFKKKTANNT